MEYLELLNFLKKVDKDFEIPLSSKCDLKQLTNKLLDYATICDKRENGEIVALVSGYTNNLVNNMAYISIVATLKQCYGNGFAKELINKFIEICKNKKIGSIHLYTTRKVEEFYLKLGFVRYVCENEIRPNDIHLIFRIQGEKL